MRVFPSLNSSCNEQRVGISGGRFATVYLSGTNTSKFPVCVCEVKPVRRSTAKLSLRPFENRVTHRGFHHVWLAVPQGLYCMENIHHVLPLHHLNNNAYGTEHAAAATAIPESTNTV